MHQVQNLYYIVKNETQTWDDWNNIDKCNQAKNSMENDQNPP